MKIKINGETFELTSMEIEGEFVRQPFPPVEDKPPMRPLPDGMSTDLGALTQASTFRREAKLYPNKVQSFSFSVSKDSSVPVLFWKVLPQTDKRSNFRVWVSETAGGTPLPGPRGGGLRDYWGKGGDGFSVITPIRGRGQERRAGAIIDTDKTYYWNMVVGGGGDYPYSFVFWSIGGNFNWEDE
jgi:hypothetical protein